MAEAQVERSTLPATLQERSVVGGRLVTSHTLLWDYVPRAADEFRGRKGGGVRVHKQALSLDHCGGAHEWALVGTLARRWLPKTWLAPSYARCTMSTVFAGLWYLGRVPASDMRSMLATCAEGTFAIVDEIKPRSKHSHQDYLLVYTLAEGVHEVCIVRNKSGDYLLAENNAFGSLYELVDAVTRYNQKGMKTRLRRALVDADHPPKAVPPPSYPATVSATIDVPVPARAIDCIIPRSQLIIGRLLGAGHFASVFEGEWRRPHGEAPIAVMLQQLEANLTKESIRDNVELMGSLSHENIVTLYGVSFLQDTWIVSELMNVGALDAVLKTLKATDHSMTIAQQEHTLWQVACGMEHLVRQQVVHRDLAARNVLLSQDRNGRTLAKLAGFGLARFMTGERENYCARTDRDKPYRWMAIEALTHGRFTSASDVWSFGMLAFELATTGGKPYATLNNCELVDHLASGAREQRPPGMTPFIYAVASCCWSTQPRHRATFANLRRIFEERVFFNVGLDVY